MATELSSLASVKRLLRHKIQYNVFIVYRAPDDHPFAADLRHDRIETPATNRRHLPPQARGHHRPELVDPASYRLAADLDVSLPADLI